MVSVETISTVASPRSWSNRVALLTSCSWGLKGRPINTGSGVYPLNFVPSAKTGDHQSNFTHVYSFGSLLLIMFFCAWCLSCFCSIYPSVTMSTPMPAGAFFLWTSFIRFSEPDRSFLSRPCPRCSVPVHFKWGGRGLSAMHSPTNTLPKTEKKEKFDKGYRYSYS